MKAILWADSSAQNKIFGPGISRNFIMKKLLLLPVALAVTRCDYGPAPLNLGEVPSMNASGELTLPMNVGKAFSPTGYFYNVWDPVVSEATVIDPEKWNNFLAYQSIYQHPSCADRVPLDTLIKYDSSLAIPPMAFYSEFNCTQFTYAPFSATDIYGGVFWLRSNNFGNKRGVKVAPGVRNIRFWARTLSGNHFIKFGAGVSNKSNLKPWPYFSEYVDNFGDTTMAPTPIKEIRKLPNSDGTIIDSLATVRYVPLGSGFEVDEEINPNWKLYTLSFKSIYNNLSKEVDSAGNPIPLTALPTHELIGAFYWAIVAENLNYADSSRMSAPIHIHREPPLADTVIQPKYGSATILIDGIRYE